MNTDKIIGATAIALAPIYAVVDLKDKTVSTVKHIVVEAMCEAHNRRNFDKKHGYIRRSKR